MRKRKLRIYLDTSVISYYTARLHADPLIRSRQLTTKRWWEACVRVSEFCVSGYVTEEIEKGDPEAAEKRLGAVKDFRILYPTPVIGLLAGKLAKTLNIPATSPVDAFHLAIAALSAQDYIVSWNFKHMANARSREMYRFLCREEGLSSPKIMTPEEMLEEGAGI